MRLSPWISCLVTVATLGMTTGACSMGAKDGASNNALSTVGESCSKTADCASPLVCVKQTCTDDASTGDAGTPSMNSGDGSSGNSGETNSDAGATNQNGDTGDNSGKNNNGNDSDSGSSGGGDNDTDAAGGGGEDDSGGTDMMDAGGGNNGGGNDSGNNGGGIDSGNNGGGGIDSGNNGGGNDSGNNGGNDSGSNGGGNDSGNNGGNDSGTPSMDSGQPVMDGGRGPNPSSEGLACNSTVDCGQGYVCIPRAGTATGVCDIAVYPVEPTGMSCGGECNTASDCCELPLGITLTSTTGVSHAIHQCQDILSLILNNDATSCANQPSPNSPIGVGCFYFETYCGSGQGGNCGGSTWSCDNNTCIYNGSCQVNAANQFGGCPSESRTGRGLITNCDTTANACQVDTSGCQSNAECGNGVPVSDVSGATCRGGNCICYDQGCYLKCSQDIDCQQGFECNSTTKLCEVSPPCSTNQDCVNKTGNVQAVCNTGVCGIPCANDHDCSPSGELQNIGLGAFNGTVCGNSGFCESVGCSSNTDCQSSSASAVNTFCVAPAAAGSGGTIVHSAITN